jgi:hypothetical protein
MLLNKGAKVNAQGVSYSFSQKLQEGSEAPAGRVLPQRNSGGFISWRGDEQVVKDKN